MNKTEILKDLLSRRILIADGAMGSQLQKFSLCRQDFGGQRFEGCNEYLCVTRPDIISGIHREYLSAGADIIETNTFGANGIVLAEYGLEDKVREINISAVKLAAEEVNKYQKSSAPRFIAGSLGPTNKSLFVTGGVSFDQLAGVYCGQSSALIEGGADILLLETAQDMLNIKSALCGIENAFSSLGARLPVMVSVTLDENGIMLSGQTPEAVWVSLEHYNLLSLGFNCGSGPEKAAGRLKELSDSCGIAVSYMPNAGIPDEEGRYCQSPQNFADKMAGFCREGWINIAGGCCGTGPEHIKCLSAAAADIAARKPRERKRWALCGTEPLFYDRAIPPLIAGEKTNVFGSIKFKKTIASENWDEAVSIAKNQIKNGAQILDVSLANPERDEAADVSDFLSRLTRSVRSPIMIDTADLKAAEAGLKECPGKCIINSVSLESGEAKLEAGVRLAGRYGAMLVVGCIDESGTQAMALTCERKLSIAERAHDIITGKFGFAPGRLLFDALVFPVTSRIDGRCPAVETIEAVKLLKSRFPDSKTLLGISNISFGFSGAARETLNSVFFHHCAGAGLDIAIINPEGLLNYSDIAENERFLAEELLFRGRNGAAEAFADFYRKKNPEKRRIAAEISPEERLYRAVVEGLKDSALESARILLNFMSPGGIVNGPLSRAMAEVGRLFSEGQLIITEVLQSAETLKAAVSVLEPHLKTDDASVVRGKMLLATVKGDVHDIGKNLVNIIFSSNGFKVLDLGVRAAPELIVAAAVKENPEIIGLSGLITKSMEQMVETARALKAAGINKPLLVGGAALTDKFVSTKIAPAYGGHVFYARDVMHGLETALKYFNSDERGKPPLNDKPETSANIQIRSDKYQNRQQHNDAGRGEAGNKDILEPPDTERHFISDYDLGRIFSFINARFLYSKHLGLKGNLDKLLAVRNQRAMTLFGTVEELKSEIISKKLMRASAVYRFFPAQSEDNAIILYEPENLRRAAVKFDFLRQQSKTGLCLSDFVSPRSGGQMDYVCIFAATCGHEVLGLADRARSGGGYLRSHLINSLAISCAEAFAEALHSDIRGLWGFPDTPSMTMQERFSGRYRGKRFSFGYPACPDISGQAKLFELLRPEKDAGVRLTENYMMEPEASVSSFIVHSPKAKYFSLY